MVPRSRRRDRLQVVRPVAVPPRPATLSRNTHRATSTTPPRFATAPPLPAPRPVLCPSTTHPVARSSPREQSPPRRPPPRTRRAGRGSPGSAARTDATRAARNPGSDGSTASAGSTDDAPGDDAVWFAETKASTRLILRPASPAVLRGCASPPTARPAVADAKPTWREANDPPRDEEDVDDEEEGPTTVNALGAVPACAGSNLRGLGGATRNPARPDRPPTAGSRAPVDDAPVRRRDGVPVLDAGSHDVARRVSPFTTSEPTTFAVTFIPGPLDASNGSAGRVRVRGARGVRRRGSSGASNAVPRTNRPERPSRRARTGRGSRPAGCRSGSAARARGSPSGWPGRGRSSR